MTEMADRHSLAPIASFLPDACFVLDCLDIFSSVEKLYAWRPCCLRRHLQGKSHSVPCGALLLVCRR